VNNAVEVNVKRMILVVLLTLYHTLLTSLMILLSQRRGKQCQQQKAISSNASLCKGDTPLLLLHTQHHHSYYMHVASHNGTTCDVRCSFANTTVAVMAISQSYTDVFGIALLCVFVFSMTV
jgi:hypothetical protein